ncbi:MAG TPA: ATP-binding protein [Solirubrobacter sp.]|nr:ATP-binding protein [Solirubrobacter sp.]
MLEALADTRVVVVIGARQVGKSTLVQHIAGERMGAAVLSLDDAGTRQAAASDPTGFVADHSTPLVIDEVQRAPDLLLAIKARVDTEQRPGQYLLTGSANILTAPRIADALTGRAEYLRLGPLTQSEVHGAGGTLVSDLLDGRWPRALGVGVGRTAYAETVAAGGYPDARERSAVRRARFFGSYLDTVIQRDLRSIAQVHDQDNVRRILSAIAAVSSSLMNVESLARDLGLPASTVRAHTSLLETLFLTVRLPAWSTNLLNRTIRTPKVFVADSGLLCHLTGAAPERLIADGNLAGPAFETFVVTELLRQAEWQEDVPRAFHFRDRDGREVDLVLERRDGSVAGVEVKAAASVTSADFRGLRHLRDKLGDRFKAGVVLYTGEHALPFGDRLAAVPISGLWHAAP